MVLVSALCVSCYKAGGAQADEDTSTGRDTASSTVDSSTGVPVDSDTGTGSGLDTGYVGPVSIRIVNESEVHKYFSLGAGDEGLVNCLDPDGKSCGLFDNFCMESCEAVTPEDYCMILCEQAFTVRVIGPGETFELTWDGMMRQTVENHCQDGGWCYITAAPGSATYQVGVRAFEAVNCFTDVVCYPAEEGVIQMAEVKGDYTEHTAELVPGVSQEVVIRVTE